LKGKEAGYVFLFLTIPSFLGRPIGIVIFFFQKSTEQKRQRFLCVCVLGEYITGTLLMYSPNTLNALGVIYDYAKFTQVVNEKQNNIQILDSHSGRSENCLKDHLTLLSV